MVSVQVSTSTLFDLDACPRRGEVDQLADAADFRSSATTSLPPYQ
jgi:hypothetical protein